MPKKTTSGTARKASTPPGSQAPGKAASAGPVTLEEAVALARAQPGAPAAPAPARRRRALAAAGDAVPFPARTGSVRQEQQAALDDELARRETEYRRTMEIMAARGARRTAARKGAGRKSLGAAGASFAPLRVVAEGDSWFDFPLPGHGGGIIPRLESRLGVPILNLAKAGDEVRLMLGLKERRSLVEKLTTAVDEGTPWDLLLFSGGGNDIVGDPMALWVRDWRAGAPLDELFDRRRFSHALGLIRAGYDEIIALRDRISPETHLMFHSYDFAVPDGREACFFGPWLQPAFIYRGFPDDGSRHEVVRAMLSMFAGELAGLAAVRKVTVLNLQGTLKPDKASWHDELHPSKAGFDRVTDVFAVEIRKLFPSRVA
ncbi:MAG: hypothetical protein RJA99_3319 [Pseudomonadota bacterium]|jgi:hypothetical protein